MNDFRAIRRKQDDIAGFGSGDLFDRLLFGVGQKLGDRRLPTLRGNFAPGDSLGAEGRHERGHIVQVLARHIAAVRNPDAFDHAAFLNRAGKYFELAVA
ncbi:hypothetical protein D3C83_58790 [compost metagenome]